MSFKCSIWRVAVLLWSHEWLQLPPYPLRGILNGTTCLVWKQQCVCISGSHSSPQRPGSTIAQGGESSWHIPNMLLCNQTSQWHWGTSHDSTPVLLCPRRYGLKYQANCKWVRPYEWKWEWPSVARALWNESGWRAGSGVRHCCHRVLRT